MKVKIDWEHLGVLALGAAAFLAKGFYEKKRFDVNLNSRYDDHLDERVSKIVDEKLKKRR